MFIGSTKGSEAAVALPTDGIYVVRVYLMRNAARRGETAQYTLTVGVTGTPMAPLSGSQDAKIPGTAFHASATVACQPPGTEPGGGVPGLRDPARQGWHGHGRGPRGERLVRRVLVCS